MTARMASWPAITAPRWRRCSSTSRAAAARPRATKSRAANSKTIKSGAVERPHHERPCPARRSFGPSHRRDDPALLVSVAVVLAAASGTFVLACHAGRHLGLPADLYRAERHLLQPDLYELVGGHLRLRPRPALRPWCGKHRLDLDVRADAARLRLLSGQGAAVLAAICVMGAAADLCLRGHARALDRSGVSGGPDAVGASHQRRVADGFICGIPCPFEQRPASRLAARRRRIARFSR